jgi:hypothetical protein
MEGGSARDGPVLVSVFWLGAPVDVDRVLDLVGEVEPLEEEAVWCTRIAIGMVLPRQVNVPTAIRCPGNRLCTAEVRAAPRSIPRSATRSPPAATRASRFGKPISRTGSASGDPRGQRVAFGTLFATSSPTFWPIAEPTSVELR